MDTDWHRDWHPFERECRRLYLGRDDEPALLAEWWETGRIHADELGPLLLGVWSGAEWPLALVGERRWVAMFKAAVGLPRPTDPLVIYRGAWRVRARGMSWTLDLERARWFARRETLMHPEWGAAVYEATVPPRAVLALIPDDDNSRGESEVVVNPNMLRGRTRILEHIEPTKSDREDPELDRLGVRRAVNFS
jgi:hypothetical protein